MLHISSYLTLQKVCQNSNYFKWYYRYYKLRAQQSVRVLFCRVMCSGQQWLVARQCRIVWIVVQDSEDSCVGQCRQLCMMSYMKYVPLVTVLIVSLYYEYCTRLLQLVRTFKYHVSMSSMSACHALILKASQEISHLPVFSRPPTPPVKVCEKNLSV